MWTKSTKLRFRGGLLALATLLVTGTVGFMDGSWLYRASILDWPEHEPFDGTVYPIQMVPDWVGLESSKWDLAYSELDDTDLVAIPTYDPTQLQKSTDELVWGNPDDDLVRNAKITYSVPYLGSYELDGVEGAGSHPAVDIKIPEGTPIFAIANGTVIKESAQSSGFGHHIVLMHNNFPQINGSSATTVFYSSYSHNSSNLVEEGDTVLKGEQIALSGSTGTATTPHLHFQIDNDQAPWHPFWPFTWSDVSEAGLTFFSAVNEGLGKESAMLTTIHPLNYVQTHLDSSGVEGPEAESYVVEEPIVEEEEPVVVEEEEPVVVEEEPVVVEEEPVVEEEVVVEEEPFVEEEVVVEEEPVVEEEEPAVEEEVVDEPASDGFRDVPEDHPLYDAVTFLTDAEIVEGYEDDTFRPEQTVNRVEALKFILEITKTELKDGELPFKDTPADEWYVSYLYTGYLKKIVEGNPDGTFKPGNTVNRAEFFKILFNGLNVDINPNVAEAPYADVSVDDWFAPYISYAKSIGLIDSEVENINPSQGMSRGDTADAMYRLVKLLE